MVVVVVVVGDGVVVVVDQTTQPWEGNEKGEKRKEKLNQSIFTQLINGIHIKHFSIKVIHIKHFLIKF